MAGRSGRCHSKRRELGSEPTQGYSGRVYNENMAGQLEEAGGEGGCWGGVGSVNDNQDKGGREGSRKEKPRLEEPKGTMKEERSIYFRSHIKRPGAEGGGAAINYKIMNIFYKKKSSEGSES